MAANNFLPGDQYNSGQTTPKDPNQVPPPGVNPDVVYTDQQGKGYNTQDLNTAWNGGSGAFATDPANSRVGDILKQYPNAVQPPPNPAAPGGALGTMGAGIANAFGPGTAQPGMTGLLGAGLTAGTAGANLGQHSDDLFNLLMGRAKQGLNVDPNDPIIKGQTDAYTANNERAQRSHLTQAAEQGGPNANLEGVARSMAEQGAQATGGLQASLMQNELTSRRNEIQQALQESGSLLTSQQQLQLQRELGLIDANLKQQGLNSQNDQFTAQLGLNSSNMSNYWDWLRSGGQTG